MDNLKRTYAKASGYKKLVSGFKNIDDKLLSIDVADLNKILHLKIFKWTKLKL